jgi:hypothetical protein
MGGVQLSTGPLCCLNLYVNLVCIIVCDLWVTGVVPIRSFLAGNLFDAQVINAMSFAFDDVCGELGLVKTAEDPATRLVAEKIIELAQRGIAHDPDLLRTMTLNELGRD